MSPRGSGTVLGGPLGEIPGGYLTTSDMRDGLSVPVASTLELREFASAAAKASRPMIDCASRKILRRAFSFSAGRNER
jgi:hypothetical protein